MKLEGEVVVTGGAGAIGSNLVRRILKEPAVTRVLVIDDLSAGHEWLLGDAVQDPRFELCTQSIDGEDVCAGFEEPKSPIVFHLAAHFANALSVEEPHDDAIVNGVGTLSMLDLSAYWSARLFVFASAGCAVGHKDTPYQIHKALGETYCRYYSDHRDLPTAVCRFHNSYGPGEVPGAYRNVIPNFIHAALLGEPLLVHEGGEDVRDFVFVADLVEDMLGVDPSSDPLEIGSGWAVPIKGLARLVVEATGSDSPIHFGSPRPAWGHFGRAAAKVSPGRVNLVAGLSTTVAWHRENRDKIVESIR